MKKLKRIFICLFSVFLFGLSSAFCIRSGFGTNSVVTFFRGISKTFNFDIGISTNIINLILTIVVFFIDKKYINIGTIIYSCTMGFFINLFLSILNFPESLILKTLFATFGIIIYIIAVALFVWSNVGVNPWIAFSLILSEKLKKSFGKMKLCVDLFALICGICLGGKFGPITIITALLCGLCVDKLLYFLNKINLR